MGEYNRTKVMLYKFAAVYQVRYNLAEREAGTARETKLLIILNQRDKRADSLNQELRGCDKLSSGEHRR